MTRLTSRYLLTPLLAIGLSFAVAQSAHAQRYVNHDNGGTSASLQITFGSQPRWAPIQGTRVRELRNRERPDYDVFSYGGLYYVYNDDRWYSCRTPRGYFMPIEERAVPREFSRIPRHHWRHYPNAWNGPNGRPGDYGRGRRASPAGDHGPRHENR